MYYTIWQNAQNRLWYWHLQAANHQIIANGEGYYNKADVLNVIALVKGSSGAPVYER